MIRLTEAFIKNIKLIDDGPYGENRKQFWNNLTTYIGSKFFGAIEVDGVFKEIGGYFTTNYLEMDKIVIPETSCDVDLHDKAGTIKFRNDEQFAIFLHEVSHYFHVIRDKGKYISLEFRDRKPYKPGEHGEHSRSEIPYLEYEAGWRSLYYSDIYNLFPEGDRTVLETNLTNIRHYCQIVNLMDFEDEETIKKRIIEWTKTTEKFSSTAEFKIVI